MTAHVRIEAPDRRLGGMRRQPHVDRAVPGWAGEEPARQKPAPGIPYTEAVAP